MTKDQIEEIFKDTQMELQEFIIAMHIDCWFRNAIVCTCNVADAIASYKHIASDGRLTRGLIDSLASYKKWYDLYDVRIVNSFNGKEAIKVSKIWGGVESIMIVECRDKNYNNICKLLEFIGVFEIKDTYKN